MDGSLLSCLKAPYRKARALAGFFRLSVRRRVDTSKTYFRFHLGENDVFLVGHPKSGNTWLALMLAILIRKDRTNQINLANVGEYIPAFHGKPGRIARYESLTDPRVFRDEWPLFPKLFPKTIYLVRDPRSVLVSYYYMYQNVYPRSEKTLAEFVEEYLRHGCIKTWEPQLKRWDRQVLFWQERLNQGQPVLLVKYEDMVDDLKAVLEKACHFAGIPYTADDISLAAKRGTLNAMRHDEELHGVEAYRGKHRQHRFIRRGESAGWRAEMTCAIAESIANEFAPVMKGLDYL